MGKKAQSSQYHSMSYNEFEKDLRREAKVHLNKYYVEKNYHK